MDDHMTNGPPAARSRRGRREFLESAALLAGATLLPRVGAAAPGVRVGIITEPYGAHLQWYMTSLERSPGVAAVAIADASGGSFAGATKVLSSRFPKIETFRDYRQLLSQFRPELALITLEPHNSPGPIDAALDSGCHVLSEKPGCVRLEDFEKLAAKASQKDRHLMLALCNRKSPTALQARALVQAGKIGKLYGTNIHLIADHTRLTRPEYQRLWRAIKGRAGGGILIWLGIHYLDLAEYISESQVRQVCGFYGNVGGQPLDTEDAAVVGMTFTNGMVGTLQTGYYLDAGGQFEFVFWGSLGWVRFTFSDPGAPLQWHSTMPGAPAGVQTYTDTSGFMVNGDNQYFPFVNAAVEAARGAPPPITSAESLHAVRTIFTAYRAADTHTTLPV
jgi:predicted dehydrogenase